MRIAKTATFAALATILGSGVFLISPAAQAEQGPGSAGAGPRSSAARVDFQITIPRFLRFRVGAVGATIDRIDFAPTADEVGTGISEAAVLGGDAGVGQVNVQVRSNAGQITIVATNAAAAGINDGGTNVIPYTEIVTATSSAVIPAPVLTNAASAPVNATLSAGNITNRDAVWTYSYANTTIPEAATYGGTNANNGRVTYTATSL